MCFPWRCYWPNGAVCPVTATDDMTQPVGIRDNRLFTAPASGGATTDYCKLSSYIETISAASMDLPLTEVLNSDSDKFAVTSANVTIGADVNALLVDLYIACPSYSTGLIGIIAYKNGNHVGGISSYVGSTSGSAARSLIIDVAEGDVLTFKYAGLSSGSYVTAGIGLVQIG